jgi:hypothetical protein
MAIWLELLVLLLVTYVAGMAIGWAIWGRRANETEAGKMDDG